MPREIITLEDATVTGVFGNGDIVHAAITNEVNGKTFTKKYTLWFKNAHHGLTVGDVFTVSGFPSDKVGEAYTGQDGLERRSVERSINSPRVTATAKASAIKAQPASDVPF
jgi:hypothetical protein